MLTEDQERIVVRTRLPRAAKVYLVAPCNNWSTRASPMTQHGQEEWEISLPAGSQLEPHCFYVRDPGELWGHIESA